MLANMGIHLERKEPWQLPHIIYQNYLKMNYRLKHKI